MSATYAARCLGCDRAGAMLPAELEDGYVWTALCGRCAKRQREEVYAERERVAISIGAAISDHENAKLAALERIAHALERAHPPPRVRRAELCRCGLVLLATGEPVRGVASALSGQRHSYQGCSDVSGAPLPMVDE